MREAQYPILFEELEEDLSAEKLLALLTEEVHFLAAIRRFSAQSPHCSRQKIKDWVDQTQNQNKKACSAFHPRQSKPRAKISK
jgi:hypothetical protein